MADGKLVFPIRFDLESAVKNASGDIDKVMRRMQAMINNRPLQTRIVFDESKGTSINAIQKRMGALIDRWNSLSNAQKYTDNSLKQYSVTAQLIIHEFATLTAATRTHAQTLSELQRASDKAVAAEEKKMAAQQKAVAKSQQMVAMLNAEETALSAVAAKMKFYQEIANRKGFGTREYQYATEQLQRLGAQYERLRAIMNSNTGNGGKDTFGAERMKATLRGAENSIESVKAKLKVLDQILSKTPQDTFGFRRASEEATRLMGVLKQLEANTPKSIAKEQEKLQKALIDEAAKRAEIYNRKRQQEAEDLAAQQKKAAEEARIKAESQAKAQQENEARKRILNEQRLSYDTLMQKIQMLEAARNKTDIGAARWQRLTNEINKAKESLKVITDEMDKAARRSERLARLREIMAMSQQSMQGLSARMQEYNAQLQKLNYGTDAFDRLSAHIAKLNAEYQKASQYAQDYAQKAFRGLGQSDTDIQVGKLRMLRDEIAQIDRQINNLYAHQNMAGNTVNQSMINQLLDQRIAKEREIANVVKTATQQQAEREKEINKIIESRKAKQKAHSDAVRATVQARKQERTMLMANERSVDNITKKLQHWQTKLNATDMKSGEFAKIAKEVERLTKKLDDARRKIAEMTGQSTSGSSRQAANARKVNEEYSKQLTYVDRLIRRMMVYGSVGMIGNFLTKVREVTAQFELQRVSLGAILQDQNKANQLFSEIKSFALKSPVSILDLTKYTKQLAAYKVGYDELFETTKKLTDVSVGLGVSMDRVVLAYGQVRATGHLRASEIRQFTEMGVPIVEELAAKLSKMNGEMVTAADVMDLVSKRGISFQMVKEVFDDMTSAGGIFYNMQEKQGNTLYGLWAKLSDAASVMYSEIGNTGIVNDGMKSLIGSFTWLMKNWRLMIGEVAALGVGFGAYKLVEMLVTKNTIAASRAADNYTRAQIRLRAATMKHNTMQALSADFAMKAAAANQKAALSANVRTAAKYRLVGATNSLKAALAGNWITLTITAIAALAVAIGTAYEKSTRLSRELGKIKEETGVLQAQSTRQFEYLVKEALGAADGSKKQKDALDELNRTYKDMLPEEALKIENLRAMKGNYNELTQAVREYIAAEQESKAINTINETEGAVQTDMQKKLREVMIDKDLGDKAMSEAEVQRFFIAFREAAQDTSKTVKEQFIEAFSQAGLQGAEEMWEIVKGKQESWFKIGPGIFGTEDEQVRAISAIGELSRSYADMERQTVEAHNAFAIMTDKLGEYTEDMIAYNDWVQKNLNSGDTILQNQQNVNMQLVKMRDDIFLAFDEAGITWQKGWENLVLSVDPNDLNKITTLNMEAIIAAIDPNKYSDLWKYIDAFRKKYNDLVPSDLVAQDCRRKFFEIAQGMKDGGDAMRQYLWDGKVALKDHVETLGDAVDRIREKVFKYNQYIKYFGQAGKLALKAIGIDVDAMIAQADAIEKLMNYEKTYLKPEEKKNKGGGRKSDTRLQELQEILQCLDKINKKYEELKAKEGDTKALEDTKRIYKSLLDNINKNGKRFGLHFDYPTEFKTLQEYRKAILRVMEDLNKNKKLKGADKAVMNLEEIIGTADADYLQKQIEKQLKDLQEKISRTKVAKEFYDKILAQTGNEELAARITYSVYPETGRDLYTEMQDQIRRIFDTGDADKNLKLKLRLDSVFDDENERINYRELDKVYTEFQNDIIEKNRDTARKLIAECQKTAASNIATWEKELAKAKDFEEQRTEIIDRETQRRMEIYKSNLPQTEKDRLAQLSRDKQSKELADLDVKEFQGSEAFVKMFEDMGTKATNSLKHMREQIQKVIEVDKDMSPENMKAMVDALEKIDNELLDRNPFGDMVEGMKGMFDAIRRLKDARNELKQAEAEYKLQEPGLDAGIAYAENEKVFADDAKIAAEQQLLSIQQQMSILRSQEIIDESQLALLRQQEIEAQNKLVTAESRSEKANQNLLKAESKKKAAKKKVEKAQDKVNDAEDDAKDKQEQFRRGVQKVGQCISAVKSITEGLESIFGDLTSDATTLGNAFNSMVQSIEMFESIMQIVIILQEAFNIATESNPWMAIAAAVLAVTAALASFITAEKVRKANKEIERQQELLDQLEYIYGRLEKAAEKAFGGDFIRGFNQQLNNLNAQVLAKQRQLEAEQSKGKKKDKGAIKQYGEDIRDLKDQIADLYGTISAQMLGADLTSAARDFAQAWLEAYKEFGNTADAMSQKFKDMIENMIVEGAMAKVMERALKPMFDMIDNMDEADFYSQDFWKNVVAEAEKGAEAANYGAGTLMNFLQQAGISVRELGGELTGISRDISTASEESINGLAAGINTQNFYIAQQLAEVRAIHELMLSRGTVAPQSGVIDYTELQNTALNHLASIERHTAETVNECRNIAARCEEQTTLMRRVIGTKGSAMGVNVLIKDWGRQ